MLYDSSRSPPLLTTLQGHMSMAVAANAGSPKATAKAKCTTTSGKGIGSNTIPGSPAAACPSCPISIKELELVQPSEWRKDG